MLVLSRKIDESLRIGDQVRVTVVAVTGQGVRIAVEAPAEIPIYREELYARIAAANREASAASEAGEAIFEALQEDEASKRKGRGSDGSS